MHNIISLSDKNLLYVYENIDLKKHHEVSLKKEKKTTTKQLHIKPNNYLFIYKQLKLGFH